MASHTDLKDKNQTVKIKAPDGSKTEKKETPDMPAKDQEKTQNSGTGSVKTGDEAPFGEIFCVLFLSGAVIAMTVKKKRSKRR